MSKTKKTIEWFAGLYEGEGCVGYYSNRCLIMALGSNDKDVLEQIVSILGVGKVRKKYRSSNPNHNQQYVWTLSKRNDVFKVIGQILPYMGKRRTQQITKAIKGLRLLPEPRKLKNVKNCGLVKITESTSRGSKLHLKNGEKPCKNCTIAERNYMRTWRKAFFKANK